MKRQILLKSIILFGMVMLISQSISAQISKGGTPSSFSAVSLSDSVQVVKMPPVNVDSLLKSDTANKISYRFGYAIDVNMGLQNSGTWDTLSNGDKIWRLRIKSDGAYSINLIYDNFWLPKDARFYVYSQDKSMILGAFTSENNKQHSRFSTDLIKGETTVLEYYEPAYSNGATLNIDKVIHGYKNILKSGHGGSGSCNNDVSCSQGDLVY